MATFVGGLVVGLINCWQITLLTLATGPLIVAAGGISNIFLHRLAENIQDAYAEAASIAEQVFVLCILLPIHCFGLIYEYANINFSQIQCSWLPYYG
jgi:signal transduction histidine kinase